jgi:hypothetical protein
MLPDALPQLIETLLRLPHLEAAQLRELIQHLPDPQATAQEMARRGWITQDQFSSLFPGPQPTPQDTMPPGCGDDEIPPEAACDDWGLTVSDEGDRADVPLELEWAGPDRTEEEVRPEPETVAAAPVLAGAASTAPFAWDVLTPPVAAGNEAPRRESDPDRLQRRWMGWTSKGLLLCVLFLGSWFAGLQMIGEKAPVRPVARQESGEANKKTQLPTAKRRETRPWIAAAKPDKGSVNKLVENVRPPEPPRPPAGEGNAKDEKVQGVERIKPVEEPLKVHTVYMRQGNREWMVRYHLDKRGKVISVDVQDEDGLLPAPPQ